ncbi:UNVERIFIED_CONTAM: hypothetical protein FKN15_014360 [Acipenser sinensis]
MEMESLDYRYKKDELFKRLKVTTFAQLVIQVASVSDLNDDENNEELRRLDDNSSVLSGTDAELLSERTNGKGGPEGTLQTAPVQFIDNNNDSGETELSPRSTLQSVISGVGEMDLDKTSQKNVNSTPASSPRITNKPCTDCPYLLLDVRDKDEYEQCHIIGAYSYPIATLSRTMNPYTKEVLEYYSRRGDTLGDFRTIWGITRIRLCWFVNSTVLSVPGKGGAFLRYVISGVGEMDLDKASQKNVNGTPASSPRITNKPYTDCPYLLLDVRDRDEYEQCRIIGGRLSRLSVGSAQSKASSARSSYTPSAACSDSARTQSSTRHWK